MIIYPRRIYRSGFWKRYISDAGTRIKPFSDEQAITASAMSHLPNLVRKYLEFAGVPGKPEVRNFKAMFSGSMKRSAGGNWMAITAEQHNFYDNPARLFYIYSSLFGIPFDGYHKYTENEAAMQIRIANHFLVVDAKGEKMTRSETVTMFNDMCVLAPATLINKSVEWLDEGENNVSARFTNAGFTIAAKLIFGKNGELANFVSADRSFSPDGKKYLSYPWSTPVLGYKEIDGRRVPDSAFAVWHTPEGEFTYAKFDLQDIRYNLQA